MDVFLQRFRIAQYPVLLPYLSWGRTVCIWISGEPSQFKHDMSYHSYLW